MGTSIRIVEALCEFSSLRTAWDDLVAGGCGGSLYMSRPWLTAAWRTAEHDSRPLVILVSERDRLLAGAALQRRTRLYYGVPFSEVSFLGDGLADRQEFLCRPDHPDATADIWRCLAGNPWRAELLRLEQIPDTSPTLTSGRETLARLQVEPASIVSAMQIGGTWDNYFRNLQAELRRDLRQSERRLTEAGDWRIRHIHGKEIEAFLPAVRDIEMAGYKSAQGKAFLADARNEGFIRAYLEAAPDDSTALTLLEVDDRIAAYSLGFVHGGTYYGYNTSFDDAFRRTGSGKYVIAQSIRYAIDRHLAVMDFSRGGSHLKARFGGESSINSRAVYFYPGIKGAAARLAVFWIRPRLNAVLNRWRMQTHQT